jgi:radical SAM superfamily enzyme YgiQ (UPF0313 family)
MSGGKYRIRSVDSIVDEIEQIIEARGSADLLFTDNTLTASRKRISDLCDEIEKRGLELSWFCESRADDLDVDIVEMMSDAGCWSIQIGLESGVQSILDASGKNLLTDNIRDAVRACRDNGIIATLSYMIGHPDDTLDTIAGTNEFAEELMEMGAEAMPSIMVPYPGTPIRERPEEFGLEILTEDWDEYLIFNPVMNTRHLNAETLRSIYFKLHAELIQRDSYKYTLFSPACVNYSGLTR